MMREKRGIRALINDTITFMENGGKYAYSINEVALGTKATWRTAKGTIELLYDLCFIRIVGTRNRIRYRLVGKPCQGSSDSQTSEVNRP